MRSRDRRRQRRRRAKRLEVWRAKRDAEEVAAWRRVLRLFVHMRIGSVSTSYNDVLRWAGLHGKSMKFVVDEVER